LSTPEPWAAELGGWCGCYSEATDDEPEQMVAATEEFMPDLW